MKLNVEFLFYFTHKLLFLHSVKLPEIYKLNAQQDVKEAKQSVRQLWENNPTL